MSMNFSRWAKESELKEISGIEEINYHDDIEISGVPLAINGKKMLLDTNVSTNLIIGATGSGKTQSVVLPMLNIIARTGESVIVSDPNGELYESTAGMFKKRGYKTVALNFKDAKLGDNWNPLAYPYYLYKEGKKDDAIKLIEDLSYTLLHETSTSDPFWEKTAANYFTGLCLVLFKEGKEEEINLNSINLMITQGEDKYNGKTYSNVYFDGLEKTDISYINASATVYAPKETRGSIISVLRQKLSYYLSKSSLSEMMANTNFDLNELRDKHIIYLILPDNQPAVYPLVNTFIEQSYFVVNQIDGKKFNYILDDFDILPPISNFDMIINTSRSRKISFTLVVRNYQNLYEQYGKEMANKIIYLCSNVFYLLTNDPATAEMISEQCGRISELERLITTDELLRIKHWECILLKMRSYPIKLTLTPNYKIEWNEQIIESSLTLGTRVQPKTFDLQRLVTEKYPTIDKLIETIDLRLAELDKNEEKKEIIEKPIKKIEIEKEKITIYYE